MWQLVFANISIKGWVFDSDPPRHPDPHIQFTTEDAKPDGSLPLLNTIVLPQPDNSLLISVYRKPTHTDLYLQWGSHHHLSAKFSVINTLRNRARTVCSNNQLLKEEEVYLNRALSNCKYPPGALNRANVTNKHNNRTNKNTTTELIKTLHSGALYERIEWKLQAHLQETWHRDVFKGTNTIRELLVHPKDKDNILKKSGVIYRYKCGKWVDSEDEYTEESGRTFAERFREHMRAPSPIYDHYNTTSHEVSLTFQHSG